MNFTKTFLASMTCTVFLALADQTLTVCGDVPKVGPQSFSDEGATIDAVMAKASIDLQPFYAEQKAHPRDSPCPIRVELHRKEKKTIYAPSTDAAALQKLPLSNQDTIVITDFRKHPEKIATRRTRIEKMLKLGSVDLMDELSDLATLEYEYDQWRGQIGADPQGTTTYLKNEAARLCADGKGQRVVDIIELKRGALEEDGLGPAHPTLVFTKKLIQIYRDQLRQ